MGDPITMAMIGAGVGAVTNPRKPLQGALLGGALGGFGGAAMSGVGKLAPAVAGSGGATGLKLGTAGSLGNLAPATTVGLKAPVSSVGYGLAPSTSGMAAGTANLTANSSMIAPSIGGAAQASPFASALQFAKENPMVTGQGLQAAGNVLFPEPMAAPTPQGLLRGTPSQEQPPQYAMGMPQINLLG